MAWYLCVDCGGSKTSAVVCDASGGVLGRANGGPSNFAYLTVEAFRSAVQMTISDALKTCTSPPSVDPVPLTPSIAFAAAWFGVSGVDSPAAVATLSKVLSELLHIPEGPRLVVANDTHLLAAPLRTLPDVSYAVTVIAGTGSISVSFELADGVLTELGRIGGWGWILGDEGGGYHIGREVVRQLLLENDHASATGMRPAPTKLQTQVMEHFSVSTIPEVLAAVHMSDPAVPLTHDPGLPPHLTMVREKRLSSLSPFVFSAAFDDGDPLALNVLRSCSSMLAAEVAVLLGERSGSASRLVRADQSVVCFGGSLVGIPAYRQMILDALASQGHVFRHVTFVDDAAATGAKGLALAFAAQGMGSG
jgi:N-acetylglucosamine kinase-like BadF-type ATPase